MARLILQRGAIEKTIEVYRFDGKTLVRDKAATVKLPGRPGAIATALAGDLSRSRFGLRVTVAILKSVSRHSSRADEQHIRHTDHWRGP